MQTQACPQCSPPEIENHLHRLGRSHPGVLAVDLCQVSVEVVGVEL